MENAPTGAMEGEKRLATLEDEVRYLRSEILRREEGLKQSGETPRVEPTLEAIRRYRDASPALDPHFALDEIQAREIVLNLSPEPHDRQMEEFLTLIEKRGIKNTGRYPFFRTLSELINLAYHSAGQRQRVPF